MLPQLPWLKLEAICNFRDLQVDCCCSWGFGVGLVPWPFDADPFLGCCVGMQLPFSPPTSVSHLLDLKVGFSDEQAYPRADVKSRHEDALQFYDSK